LSDLAGVKVSQPTVSSWESGRTRRPQPRFVEAIQRYVAAARVGSGVAGHGAHGVDERNFETFAALVRTVSEEPLLGPQQERFVAAVTDRLANGPPLADVDVATLSWLADSLGLDGHDLERRARVSLNGEISVDQ